MSVDDPFSIDVDGADNCVRAVVVERREVEVDELFRDGELRLWDDSEGWSGYLREKLLGFGVWKISVRRDEPERSVRDDVETFDVLKVDVV